MNIVLLTMFSIMQSNTGGIKLEISGGPLAKPVFVSIYNPDQRLTLAQEVLEATHIELSDLSTGTYRMTVTSGSQLVQSHKILVTSNQVTQIDLDLDLLLTVDDVLTVHAVSRRKQNILKAPAAVSVIRGFDLEAGSQAGQLPFALNHLPGVQISQTGTFDFNINTRGLNSFLNRRVVVLLDGRNTAVTQLGNQEWFAMGLAPQDIESMELVHGPGSALYGANAFNGILDIRSKAPADNPGGSLQLTLGEQDMWGGHLQHNWRISDRLAIGIKAGTFFSDQWEQSRTADDPVEYPGVPTEVLPLDRPGLAPNGTTVNLDTRLESRHASLRLDFRPNQTWLMTAELGTAVAENFVGVADIGRGHIREVERPWARLAAETESLHFSFWRTERKTPEDEHFLASGGILWEDSYDQQAELTWDPLLPNDDFTLVVGASYHWQNLDTSKPGDPENRQSSIQEPVKADQQSLFSQVTWQPNAEWEVVLADRYDRSSLHPSRHSPKAALVWIPRPNQSLRLTYNKAFQPPSFPDFFLYAQAGALNLSGLEEALESAVGQSLPTDFGLTPILAVGNQSLEVERIETIELGYRGLLANSWFATCNIYRSEAHDFVTELLPGANPNIAPYQLPASLPDALAPIILNALQGALGPFYAGLANAADGSPYLALSYTNAGKVNLTGIDASLIWTPTQSWQFDGFYHWLDYDSQDENLASNAPSRSLGVGFVFTQPKWNASSHLNFRNGYDSAGGIFAGYVPKYTAWDAQVSYQITRQWQLLFNGSNLLDDAHYDQFGGALIGRMTSLSCRLTW